MDDPWELLQLAASEALAPLWSEFAKNGTESAVLAPLAQYPNAAAWLAQSMAMSTYCITRKLGAMLAGWVRDPQHVRLLSEMLDRERQVFSDDPLSANSVGEDIMFAATRWTESGHAQVRNAGIYVLASMISDALAGTPWNTVHWAVANLHDTTDGKHDIFEKLKIATEEQMEGQQFLRNAVRALRQKDRKTLDKLVTAPSELRSLSPNAPHYSMASSLWNAAAAAEGSLG